jgi:hypothetical protein
MNSESSLSAPATQPRAGILSRLNKPIPKRVVYIYHGILTAIVLAGFAWFTYLVLVKKVPNTGGGVGPAYPGTTPVG